MDISIKEFQPNGSFLFFVFTHRNIMLNFK